MDSTPDEPDVNYSTIKRLTVRNPVLHTLTAMTVISVFSWAVAPGGVSPLFTASQPIGDPWYGLLLANYTHLNASHLFSNAFIIAIAGGIISISSTMYRFHAFFIITGVVSTVAQVAFSTRFGYPIAVLGSSGAAFALMGYLLTSNPVSLPVLKGISARAAALLLLIVGGVVTVIYSAPGSAILSHFVGVLLGLGAGRFRLLKR